MVKRILGVLAAVLLLALSGACGGASPEPAPLPPATSTTEPEPAAWVADGVISPGEYPIAVEYDAWQVAWRTDDTYAYFGLRAATDGYVALGIQPGRTMKDADMVFGYVDDGVVTVLDVFSTGSFGPHPADTVQGGADDILEAGGSESGGFTVIEFKRALVTGDAYDLPLEPGVNRIIWAYGPADSPDAKHAGRGYGEIIIE
jgi:hypothetical protein